MATPKTTAKEETTQEAVKPTTKTKTVASVYTTEQLINNYKAFNTSKEIVKVALKLSGKDRITFDEAKRIVDAFRNKEVK